MRSAFNVGVVALAASFAAGASSANEYQGHDLHGLVTFSDSPTGKQMTVNIQNLDQMLGDLSLHTRNYPPHFDSPEEKDKVISDTKALAGLLDIICNSPSPNLEMLLRAGIINSIGANLDIPGSAEKASANFQKLLSISPDHPRGHYYYGLFLGNTAKPKEAIPHLEKAQAAGIPGANWSLGMAYLSIGNQQKALATIKEYQKQNPNDPNAVKVIDTIESGRVQIRHENAPSGNP